jgi:raffinose/stachyose/melibiose transport system permease protein
MYIPNIKKYAYLYKRGPHILQKPGYYLDCAIFLLPTILVLLLIVAVPFMLSLYLSLTSWNGVSSHLEFVGLKNFLEIFTKQRLLQSFWFTLRITVIIVVLVNAAGIFLAEMLTLGLKGSSFFRAGYYLPNTMGGIVVGFIWQFIFVRGFSAIGKATGLGLFQLQWLGTVHTAFWALVIVTCWQSLGFVMIVMIAALTGVPRNLIEAARIDGAGYWCVFFRVKMPHCLPYLSTCLFWTLSLTFKMFDLNMSLTKGGPFGSTTSISQMIYQDAFSNNRYGYATAEALIFFVILFIITSVQMHVTNRREG